MDKGILSLSSLFTTVIIVGVILYAVYMIKMGKDVRTPDNRTYRLAFCLLIIVAISFLSFGCDNIDEKITTLFGTVAGYVLGGVKWKSNKDMEISGNKNAHS